MAWTVTDRGEDYVNGSSDDLVLPSFTPNAGSILVCAMVLTDNVSISISGHDDGVSWGEIYSLDDHFRPNSNPGSGYDFKLYACIVGSSPSAGTVTISKSYTWRARACLIEIQGDHDTSPAAITDLFGTHDSFEEGHTGTTAYSLTLPSFESSENMTLMCTNEFATFDASPPYTMVGDTGSGQYDILMGWHDGEDNSPSVTNPAWTDISMSAIEVKEASGGGSTVEGTLAASIDMLSSLIGKIGVGGGLVSTAGSAALSQAGQEGKQGPLASILSALVPSLSGRNGVSGDMVPVMANSLLSAAGKQGNQGPLTGQISLTAQLFGTTDGQPPVVVEGTLSSVTEALNSDLFGNVGVDGSFTGQMILAASLAGQLGASGSYTMQLAGISSLIEGALGVAGEITTTISAGADLAGKLGISAELVASLDNLGLQLIEIVRSDKIYQLVLSTQSGQVVLLVQSGQVVIQEPQSGKIEISTIT